MVHRGRLIAVGMGVFGVMGVGAVGCATKETTPEEAVLVAPGGVLEEAWRGGAWDVFGRSVQGRALGFAVVGVGARRAVIVAGIHGDEREGGRHAEEMLAWLGGGAGGARVEGWTLLVIRDVNPDGSALGKRGNANGVDLNRNWPAQNFRGHPSRGAAPLDQPEARAVDALLGEFGGELVVVFHAMSRRDAPLVNYDGPASAEAEAFARGAEEASGARWRVTGSWGRTPGSLGSYVGDDKGVPILTVEFRTGMVRDATWDSIRGGLWAVLGEESTEGWKR